MPRFICIHGHFYQPPRENPWLGAIEAQESARPFHDWNRRVAAECYRPNANAHILDGHGLVLEIVNNYGRISFDFGPTLLAWLETAEPDIYSAVIAAERDSHSAMAQAYNHIIMPLANQRDRVTQVAWGIRDFIHRFGREPEGMWLPETAVDIATLETLAAANIRYTVLAPHQARRVRAGKGAEWADKDAGSLDTTRAYRISLPSGRTLALFFYNGAIAHQVAFDGILRDGSQFAARLLESFVPGDSPELVHIATDGETYGHHHRFGEMALAAALRDLASRPGVEITNYTAFLNRFPPVGEVEIVENSSWSCAHGVERWRSDCGCNAGAFPEGSQAWRAPLRAALDWLRDALAPLYERAAEGYFQDPWAARDGFIEIALDSSQETVNSFFHAHARRPLSQDEQTAALGLLGMQHQALLMFTSCGWFFDEISGIETVQILQYAARAMELCRERAGADLEPEFLSRLESAPSNLPQFANGRAVYERLVGAARAHGLQSQLEAAARAYAAATGDDGLLENWLRLARAAQAIPVPVPLWETQNVYWKLLRAGAKGGLFLELGRILGIHV